MIDHVYASMGKPRITQPQDNRDDQRALIDAYLSHTQGMKILAAAGLTDAAAMAKAHNQLSTGQQARDDIARLIAAGPGCIILDEYLAHLDRTTAKAVAWSVSRTLRKQGIGAILITANDDIAADVSPDLWVKSGWTPDAEVIHAADTERQCSLLESATVARGSRTDWLAMKPLHYAAGDPATTHSIFTVRVDQLESPAGVVVYSYPDLHSAARNLHTENRYRQVAGRRAANLLNREVVKLSRLVIAPQVRSIGLAHVLLSETIPVLGARYVECVTAMGRFSSFLERVGFEAVPNTTHEIEAEWLDWCGREQPPAPAYLDGQKLLDWIDGLSVRRRREGRRLIWSHYHHFVLHRRTRTARPKNVPNPDDARWAEAADLAARRMIERPEYYIVGPMDPATGLPETAPADA